MALGTGGPSPKAGDARPQPVAPLPPPRPSAPSPCRRAPREPGQGAGKGPDGAGVRGLPLPPRLHPTLWRLGSVPAGTENTKGGGTPQSSSV